VTRRVVAPGEGAALDERDAHGLEIARRGRIDPGARALRDGQVGAGNLKGRVWCQFAAAQRQAGGGADAAHPRQRREAVYQAVMEVDQLLLGVVALLGQADAEAQGVGGLESRADQGQMQQTAQEHRRTQQ